MRGHSELAMTHTKVLMVKLSTQLGTVNVTFRPDVPFWTVHSG